MNITQVRLTKLKDSKTLALASITLDEEFVVTGLKVLNGSNGLWVAMPNRKKANNEYTDIVYPVTKEARETIQKAVLTKYQEEDRYAPKEEPYQAPVDNVSQAMEERAKGLDVTEDDLPF